MKAPRLDDAARHGADEVARALTSRGFAAFLAGGCVRDLLLGQTPKDYDVATDATPPEVQRLFRRTVLVGASFGVVRVVLSGGREYEVATFRTEGEYLDGRRPEEVRYTRSHVEDVERRDFTINALLLDPVTDEVIDVVGGLEDLRRGVIRAVGHAERRIAEDKLRMLRAVRFAARLGFTIEASTEEAIARAAPELAVVSVERVVTEVQGTWACARAGLGVRMWRALGLWDVMFPWARAVDVEALATAFDRLSAARVAYGVDAARGALVGWALLLDRAQVADAERALREAKLSRDAMRSVLAVLAVRPVLDDAGAASLAARARVLVSADAAVMRAYAAAKHGPEAATVRALDELAGEHARDPLPAAPLVTGADLKALGLAPGPLFKDVLGAVEDAVLERRVRTREEALAVARAAAGL